MPTAAYLAQANAPTKRVQWLVEIELDRCSRTYTQAPCTASDQGDGSRCHYSHQTCQDPANYGRTTRVYRFCLQDVPWCDETVQVFPLLQRLVPVPQRIDPDKLSTWPEQVRLVMARDYVPPPIDHDKGAGFHNTGRVGEFWANLVARNANYAARPVRIYRGFYVESGFALADFERVGPVYRLRGLDTKRETVTVVAESSLAELDKRQVPFSVSDDNVIQNVGGITSGAATVDVRDAFEYPDPAAYTRNRVYVEIESEICEVTTRDTILHRLTITRGQFSTTAAGHAQGTPVAHVVCFGALDGAGAPGNAIEFLEDLLEWAGVPAADVDVQSFDLVRLVAWPSDDARRIVRKPVKVAKLVQEIRDTRGVVLFMSTAGKWAAAVFGPSAATVTIDDTMSLDDTVQVEQDDEERITRIIYLWDPTDDGAGGSEDFGRAVAVINTDLESVNSFGEARDKSVTDRWLDALTPVGEVRNIARRIITRLRLGVRRVKFRLETRDATGLNVGDLRLFKSRRLTGTMGQQLTRNMLVLAKREIDRGSVEFEAVDTVFSGPFLRMGPDTMTDSYGASTDDDRQYGYWGDADNRLGATNDPGYIYF